MSKTAVYKLADVKTSPRGAVRADLTEDGVVIGKVRARAGDFRPPFTVEFLSNASRNRFSSYCDSLSFGEVLEILYNE